MEKLALFGGSPVCEEKIPLHIPYLDEKDVSAVADQIRSTWIGGDGPKGKELEENFKRYFGVNHALFLNSCTAALELPFMVTGLNSGDFLVPNFTFNSTATVGLLNNLNLKLVDVNADDGNISIDDLRKKITPETKAIIPVHYAGVVCEMDEINQIARENNCLVIEDAAQAIGSEYRGRKAGTLSDFGCFSFHSTKNLTCGEGGLLLTNNDAWAEKCYVAREKGSNKRHFFSQKKQGYYDFVDNGRSFVQTDILAALALEQFKKIDLINSMRENQANFFLKHLSKFPYLKLPPVLDYKKSNWHVFPVRVPAGKKDFFIKALNAEGIGANVHYTPLHLNSLYQKLGLANDPFPGSNKLFDSLIRIPIYPGLTLDQLNKIVFAFEKINHYLEENPNGSN